jgi:hypothetical protein
MLTALIIIIVHYIADFMFQTEKMATTKSENIDSLIKHGLVYTFVFFIAFSLWCAYNNHITHLNAYELGLTLKVFWFFPITFVFHVIVDFFTSKIVKRKFENKSYYTGLPNFGVFSIIGMDQVIHYIILFATYYFVTH